MNTDPMFYSSGEPYRPVRTAALCGGSLSDPPMFAIPIDWDWPRFWDYVHTWMREQGYAHSTVILYRQVLQNLARFTNAPPAAVNRTVRTTLRYTRCALPAGAVSPLDDEPIPADPPSKPARPAGNKLGERTLLRDGSALARLARTPAQFLHLLRSQLGARIFATRRPVANSRCHREPTTGPP